MQDVVWCCLCRPYTGRTYALYGLYSPQCRPSRPTPTSSSSLTQNSFPPISNPSSGPIYTFVIAQRALYDTLTPTQIRPLAKTDYTRSHLSVLSVLTVVSDPGVEAYSAAFDRQRLSPSTYFTLVIIDKPTDQIVAVGCVFIEQKFLRGLGKVGHIEDIAVNKNVQGKKLGLRVIQALTAISEAEGCYKTILNCSDDNIRKWSACLMTGLMPFGTAFYVKCGYQKKENEMVSWFPARFPVPSFFAFALPFPCPFRSTTSRRQNTTSRQRRRHKRVHLNCRTDSRFWTSNKTHANYMADGEVALGLGFELRKDIFTTVRMLLYSILDAVCYCIAKATSPNKAEREGTLRICFEFPLTFERKKIILVPVYAISTKNLLTRNAKVHYG